MASRSGERIRLQQALHGSLISVDLVVTSPSTCNELCQGPGPVEFPAPRAGQVLHAPPFSVTAVAVHGRFRQGSADIVHALVPIAVLPSGAKLADGLFSAGTWDFHGAWP